VALPPIIVIDASRQPAAEPEVDHPLEAVAVRREQGPRRLLVAGGSPPDLLQDRAIGFHLCVVHTL
jgi:hypothetical protein